MLPKGVTLSTYIFRPNKEKDEIIGIILSVCFYQFPSPMKLISQLDIVRQIFFVFKFVNESKFTFVLEIILWCSLLLGQISACDFSHLWQSWYRACTMDVIISNLSSATIVVKQTCPLSLTFFLLHIDDFGTDHGWVCRTIRS